MNADGHLKLMIGDLVATIARAAADNEALLARVAELEAQLAVHAKPPPRRRATPVPRG